MSQRIPENAFELYVGMGAARSYAALAEKLDVTKRSIVKHAAREKWAERLEKIQREVREQCDKRLAEELADMHERHIKLLKVMAGKVVKGLSDFDLGSCMEALRGGELVIKLQRLVMGEPSEHSAVSIEEITRQEIHDLLKPVDDEDEDDAQTQAG